MTREEKKKEKLKKEKTFISSIKGVPIDSKTKDKYRTTQQWKDLKKELKKERKVDAFTGRPLTKTWNCHHRSTDSSEYTSTNKAMYLTLNNQQHSLYHIIYEEMRKNPKYLDLIKKQVLKDLKMNNWESFVYKKPKKNGGETK